jgi:hypothetical protein
MTFPADFSAGMLRRRTLGEERPSPYASILLHLVWNAAMVAFKTR